MGKILFMTPVAADAKGAETHAAEQLRAIDKIQDLIERLDELNTEESITLSSGLQSLGLLKHSTMLEQQAIGVNLTANRKISAYYDAHGEDPSDERLKDMRIQVAQDLGAKDVVTLLEHDPDRYRGFMDRFLERVYERIKDEQPSKGGANG